MNYYVVAQLSSQIVDVVHKEYYVYISDSKHLPIVLAEQAVHVCIACSLISKASSERLHHNDHACMGCVTVYCFDQIKLPRAYCYINNLRKAIFAFN